MAVTLRDPADGAACSSHCTPPLVCTDSRRKARRREGDKCFFSAIFFCRLILLAFTAPTNLCWLFDGKHKGQPVYWYDSSGGVEFENRDVVNELCEQHGEESSVEALKKAGYTVAMSVGKYGTALIDLFFAQGDEEFSGIALMWMGEGCECYVFREVHAGMVFMKEFSPMIAAILQAESLVKAG